MTDTVMDLNEFKRILDNIEIDAYRVADNSTDYRRGQSLFNGFCSRFPGIANKIRATEDDCFHLDSKIEAFKQRAIEIWIECHNTN
jgi:hypothetical protein